MIRTSLIFAVLCVILASASAFVPSSNAALRKSSSLGMTVLTAGTKRVDVKEGTPLKNVVGKLGIKPKYSCKK